MKWLRVALIACMIAVSALAYAQLPPQMPMHWNIRGEIDAYMPKERAAWWLVGLTMVLAVMMLVWPKIDPKRDEYVHFEKEWEIMQTGIIGFLAYLHGLILYLSLHPEVKMIPLLLLGMGALFVLLGVVMGKVEQNYFIGIKTPWTLSDANNWKQTQRFAGGWFVGVGVIMMIEAYGQWQVAGVVFSGIMLCVLLPYGYSYHLYRQQLGRAKSGIN